MEDTEKTGAAPAEYGRAGVSYIYIIIFTRTVPTGSWERCLFTMEGAQPRRRHTKKLDKTDSHQTRTPVVLNTSASSDHLNSSTFT
jgi:hypothetical protein